MRKKRAVYILFITLSLFRSAAVFAENYYPLDEEEEIPLLSIGMSVSYSLGIGSNFFIPVSHLIEPSVFIRLFDLLDISLHFYPFTLEVWMPGQTYHIGTTLLYRIGILLSPEIGVYFPSIGLSYAYMGLNPHMFEGQDAFHSPSVTIAPLRFSLRKMIPLPEHLMPFFSVAEINYGSIVPSNRLPSFSQAGNFLLNIDFLRIGCIIHVL